MRRKCGNGKGSVNEKEVRNGREMGAVSQNGSRSGKGNGKRNTN
jgi:hypothetical protein